MKAFFNFCIVAVMAVIMTSCSLMGPSTKEQLQQATSTKDSLMAVVIKQQNDLSDLVATLNQTAEKLDEINGQIAVRTDDHNLQNQRERLLQQLENVQLQIEEKQKMLDTLQKKYNGLLGENKELKKSITRMQQEITGYQARIAKYETTISQQSTQISQLNSTLSSTQQSLKEVTATAKEQEAVIGNQDKALNKVYYIVAKKSALKDLGLVKGGIFNKARLTTKGFDSSSFTQVDRRDLQELPLNSKSARILSPAPESSYELEKGVDKRLTLKILDADLFWSNSQYLVVMID